MALVDSVRAGLAELEPLDVRDRATADLALLYAKRIDAAASGTFDDWGDKQRDPVAELGPKLLACLVQLGMTPAARKNVVGDKPAKKPANPLDELRARRAARTAT
jgi:hypothetical protein